MSIFLVIPLVFLGVVSSIAGVYYGVVLNRTRRTLGSLPTLRDGAAIAGPPTPDGWPSVCVVVPAHNESAIIGTLVRSLLAQDYQGTMRFVFALDRCTDDTAGAIRAAAAIGDGVLDRRIEIVTVESCPEDWAGKTHAVHMGVQGSDAARTADLVLFTDADTSFEPSCIRAAVMLLHSRSLDMLSLLPTLTNARWFERIAQPAAGMELIRRFPLDRINREKHSARFANGQFMLFRRTSYETLGGHAAVHGALLEDLAFARLLRKKRMGMRGGVLLADGLMQCRMYPDLKTFRRGWKRIYIESAHGRPESLLSAATRLLLVGALVPMLTGLAIVAGAAAMLGTAAIHGTRLDIDWLALAIWLVGSVGLGVFVLAMSTVYRSQRVPTWLIALYPFGALIVVSILREAASDLTAGRAIEWAGRSYPSATPGDTDADSDGDDEPLSEIPLVGKEA